MPDSSPHSEFDVIEEFIVQGGYEIVTMSDGHQSAVPMETEKPLAALRGLQEQLEAAHAQLGSLDGIAEQRLLEIEHLHEQHQAALDQLERATRRERDELRQLVAGYTSDVDHYASEAQKYRDELYKAGWSDPAWSEVPNPATNVEGSSSRSNETGPSVEASNPASEPKEDA